MQKVYLVAAFATFDDCWSPKVAGEINEMLVKLVKLEGIFHWHHHELEDELFLVTAGRMRMGLRSGGALRLRSIESPASSRVERNAMKASLSLCCRSKPRAMVWRSVQKQQREM